MRRDFENLERRRMEAGELLGEGVNQSEVARCLGVHRQSVIRWARQLEHRGVRGLRKARRAGRKPKLSAAQLRRIAQALKRVPETLGFSTGLWTAARVRGSTQARSTPARSSIYSAIRCATCGASCWWSGRAATASSAAGQRVRCRPARPACDRAVVGLCPGTQSGGVHPGLPETSRASQLLSSRLRPTQLPGPAGGAPDAPPPAPGALVLVVSPPSLVAILCRRQ